MLEEVEFEEIMDELDNYKIFYKKLFGGLKGGIDYNSRFIIIDPIYHEDVDTLLHEYAHHFYELELGWVIPEEDIEEEAQDYLTNVQGARHCLDNYLHERLGKRHKLRNIERGNSVTEDYIKDSGLEYLTKCTNLIHIFKNDKDMFCFFKTDKDYELFLKMDKETMEYYKPFHNGN